MIKNPERKRAYKRIEWMFRHWRKLERAVLEAREDRPRNQNIGGGHGGYVSDPTASTAIRNITPIKFVEVDDELVRQPERWLSLMEHVYSQCSDVEKQVFHKRYFERVNPTRTAIDLYMAETTYFDLLNGIKSYAVEVALQDGLITIRKSA